MRLAIFSDIHGNLPALEAALADAAARRADAIVNLGDILSGPLWPVETADRLIALDLPTIAGNHERQLLTEPRLAMGASDRFAADRLAKHHWDWLAALPPTLAFAADLLLVHGTPDDDLEFFLETVTIAGRRPATPAEIEARAGTSGAATIVCGHSHIARIVARGDGRQIVNPGSVGLQAFLGSQPHAYAVENGSPHARYAMLEGGDGDGWQADLIQVAYDWDAAAAQAERNGSPEWAIALRTGYNRPKP